MKSILEKHVKLHFHLRQNFECGASCSMLTFQIELTFSARKEESNQNSCLFNQEVLVPSYRHMFTCTSNYKLIHCTAVQSNSCKKSYHSQPLGYNMTLPIGCLLTAQSIIMPFCGLCLNPTCNIINFPDPPEIELETDRVHSGDNKEAHLTCLIHGNPAPTVRKLIIAIHFFQGLHFCL